MSNNQPTKVYIVTSGSYSDYRIMRVYLDKDEAERFVESYNSTKPGEYADIEAWDVGSPAKEHEGPGWVANSWIEMAGSPYVKHENIHTEWIHEPANTKAKIEVLNDYFVKVIGYSREHVEKTLHDTVAQIKARSEGIT